MRFTTTVRGVPVVVCSDIVVEDERIGSTDNAQAGTIDYNLRISTLSGGNADWLTKKMTSDDWERLEREADDRNN
jgi:hypothetical protein